MMTKFSLIPRVLLLAMVVSIPFLSIAESGGGSSTESKTVLERFSEPFTGNDVDGGGASDKKPAVAGQDQTLMDAVKDYLDSHAPGSPPEAEAEAIRRMDAAQERFEREHPMPSASDMIVNTLISFSAYLFFPLAIRFVFLRRPVRTRWAAILILLVIFVASAIELNRQRDKAHCELYKEIGLPYKPRPHMIGSPLLYIAIVVSYSILRKKEKNKPRPGATSSAAVDASPIMADVEHTGRTVSLVTNSFTQRWKKVVDSRPHRVAAIAMGCFMVVFSSIPIWVVTHYYYNWLDSIPYVFFLMFIFPFIGVTISVIMIFVSFLKE